MTDIAGNTRETALDLALLSNTPQIINDEIGDTDSNDFFQFEIDENSTLNLTLSELEAGTGSTNLRLFNSEGQNITSTEGRSDRDGTITRNLTPGTYFALVTKSGVGTTYQLEANAISLGAIPPDNGSDTPGAATDLGILSETPVVIDDYIGDFNNIDLDTNDYFRIELAEDSNLNISLSGLSENASLLVVSQKPWKCS